jgi:hypothetical protein
MARPGARNSHGRNRRESSLAFADFEVRGARVAVFSEAIFMKRKGLWNGELGHLARDFLPRTTLLRWSGKQKMRVVALHLC